MWNNKIKLIFYILLFYCSGLCVLFAEEQKIEWSPSKLAKSYKLEIREMTSKKVKLNIKVKPTSYNVNNLDPGLYEYRIGIINDKEVIIIYSDWTTLSIIQAFEPEGSVDEVYYGGKQDKFQEIYISGNNFYEDTKVEVFSSQGKIPIKNLVRVSDTEMKFVLDISNAKVGVYDLKIINPLEKIYVKQSFYILGNTRKEAEKKIDDANKTSQGVDTSVNRKYFIRSMFIPGWGQYTNGKDYQSKFRRVKGGILFSTMIAGGLYLAVSYRDFLAEKNKVDQLNSLNNILNYPYNPSNSISGTFLSQQFTANASDLNNKWHSVTNASYFLLGVYLINLVDAYFFTGSIIQNTNASSKTVDKNFNLKAYIVPDRIGNTNVGSSYVFEYSVRF